MEREREIILAMDVVAGSDAADNGSGSVVGIAVGVGIGGVGREERMHV